MFSSKLTLKNNIILFLLFSVFFLMPVYVFPSGGFQLVDIPIVLISIYIIITFKTEFNFSKSGVIILAAYVFWATLVNLIHFFFEADIYLLKVVVQILYSFIIFGVFTLVFKKILLYNKNTIVLVLSLVIMLLPLFLFTGQYDANKETISFFDRNALSFNNPNQLAYFAILLYSMMIILYMYLTEYDLNKLQIAIIRTVGVIIFLLTHFIILCSASRAGILGVLMLDSIVLWQIKKNIFLIISLCIVFFIISLYVNIISDIQFSELRVVSKFTEYDVGKSLSKRIAQRFYSNISDWKALIYGSGKTIPDEYRSEVHNGFIEVFVAYGIIGFLLFNLFFFFLTLRLYYLKRLNNKICYMLVFFTVIVYNLTHNGFRFRLFWVFLALLYVIITLLIEKNKYGIQSLRNDFLLQHEVENSNLKINH